MLPLSIKSFYFYFFICSLGGGPHVSIIASTMGSSLIRYSIEVPKEELKFESPCRAFPAGQSRTI